MVAIWFPGLTIPRIRITAGQFLNITLLGVGIKVPPISMTILPRTVIWEGFKMFDTNDITNALLTPINAIPQAVWNLFKGKLDEMADEFYARRGGEVEK